MATIKRQQRKSPPSVKVTFDDETWNRILDGPLKTTRGNGITPWARGLIIDALESYEAIMAGRTQLDGEAFQQSNNRRGNSGEPEGLDGPRNP